MKFYIIDLILFENICVCSNKCVKISIKTIAVDFKKLLYSLSDDHDPIHQFKPESLAVNTSLAALKWGCDRALLGGNQADIFSLWHFRSFLRFGSLSGALSTGSNVLDSLSNRGFGETRKRLVEKWRMDCCRAFFAGTP